MILATSVRFVILATSVQFVILATSVLDFLFWTLVCQIFCFGHKCVRLSVLDTSVRL